MRGAGVGISPMRWRAAMPESHFSWREKRLLILLARVVLRQATGRIQRADLEALGYAANQSEAYRHDGIKVRPRPSMASDPCVDPACHIRTPHLMGDCGKA